MMLHWWSWQTSGKAWQKPMANCFLHFPRTNASVVARSQLPMKGHLLLQFLLHHCFLDAASQTMRVSILDYRAPSNKNDNSIEWATHLTKTRRIKLRRDDLEHGECVTVPLKQWVLEHLIGVESNRRLEVGIAMGMVDSAFFYFGQLKLVIELKGNRVNYGWKVNKTFKAISSSFHQKDATKRWILIPSAYCSDSILGRRPFGVADPFHWSFRHPLDRDYSFWCPSSPSKGQDCAQGCYLQTIDV